MTEDATAEGGGDGETVTVTPGEDPTADSSTDDGHVHRPSGEPPRRADPSDEFGWEGWALVATVVVGFLVVPAALLVLPAAQGFVRSLGLTLRAAYLALPLVPAFLLGAVAVWSALRARR
ncbi:hypothetical protein [Haloarcula litorea]|uniref:hypothetical protein n=1 Tax=Haloarcula litorea TaxID=3032579 RepID=UPI0023E87435|nr:hypothetical protein [Halomicroarcula sp. GDY20]